MFIAWTILPLLSSSGFPESLSYLPMPVLIILPLLSEAAGVASVAAAKPAVAAVVVVFVVVAADKVHYPSILFPTDVH